MADLTITASAVKLVRAYDQLPAGPTDEALNAGEALRLNTTNGKYTPGNATSSAEARVVALAINTADYAGATISALKKGILDVGDALSALAYDAPVYLSNTDGVLADAAGTVSVVVGRVIPGWGATTADKLLLVDL